MARSTLARHRTLRSLGFGRDTDPGAGGGGGNPGGGGNSGGQPGTGGGNPGGGGGDPGGNGGGNPGAGAAGVGPNGYPENTPLEQMTVEHREAYWKHYARQHESTAKARADYDEQKRLADQWREHQRNQLPADQRAIQEAEERGRQAATQASLNDRVAEVLRVALEARGVTGDDLGEAVAFANPAAFITDGKVDTAKVSAYAARQAGGASGGNGSEAGGRVDLGQGRRDSGSAKSVATGRDLFDQRRKPRQAAGTNA